MAISETDIIVGAKKYATFYDESVYGVKPGSPTYFHVPLLTYDVKMNRNMRQSKPFVGTFQNHHNQPNNGMPQGSFSLPLYGHRLPSMNKSIAEYFLQWAFADHETTFLPSKGVEWAEGPDVANKRHNGVRINSATLTGSSDTGNIVLSCEVMGQTEENVATAQTLPTNRYKLIEFEYCGTDARADTTFFLGANGDEEIHPKSFTITVNNGLKPEYLEKFYPSIMPKTQRVVTLQLTFPKQDDVYDAYNRLPTATELVGQFILKGLHQGVNGATGGTNWTQVILDMARCSIIKPGDQGAKDDTAFHVLDMVVLKPQTSANDIVQTWSQES